MERHTFLRCTSATVVGIALAVLGTVAHQVQADAAVSNPGFESGLTGWSANSGTAATVVGSPVHGGANAVALRRTSSTGFATLTDNPDMLTGVTAGTVCRASAWALGPPGTKGTVKLIAMNGKKAGTAVTKTVSFSGDWQLLPEASLTMPSGYSSINMQFFAGSFPVGKTWYLDDVAASCGDATGPTPTPTEPTPTPTEPTPTEPTPTPTPTEPTPTPTPLGEPVDRAGAAGIYDGTPIHSFGAYPYDYDRDGLEDVLINPHNETGGLRLYKNNGDGTFRHVYAGQFITRSPAGTIRNDRHGCDWGDVNNDGLPDLFCTMGANHGTLTDKANELWIQQASGGFLNKSMEYGVHDPLGVGRTGEFLDVNNDGYLDLYVTNHYRSDGQASPNRLFVNQGGTSYKDSPEYGVNVELGGMPGNQGCAHSLDFNKDGWLDILACGNKGLTLYRNNAGTSYTDVTSTAGIAVGQWRAAQLSDLDGDGNLDLVGINANATQFRVQLWRGTAFAAPSAVRPTTAARHVAVGDVNADGNRDVYIVEGTTAPDVMLIGDASGTMFRAMATPQAATGTGQSATPFDHDQNGTTDLIVMHGYSDDGPIQLISFPKP